MDLNAMLWWLVSAALSAGRAQLLGHSQQITDEQLMAAYVVGDESAFGELFDRYGGVVLGIARRYTNNDQDARDVVQQAFLNLHRARFDFRRGSPLRPWLVTIALNVAREQGRRHARNQHREEAIESAEPVDEAPLPSNEVETRERKEQVTKALAKLPESQREVIELHWFSELSFREIGDVVGASLSAVKVRAHRGYGTLRELLASEKRTR